MYEIIDQSFQYDNGDLIWIGKNSARRKAGQIVGTVGSHGYLSTWFGGKHLLVHRIIYFLHHKNVFDSKITIDHIDGNRLNNKIENLRLASYSENQSNKKLTRNTSGAKNVCWDKATEKWRVRVNFEKKRNEIGLFLNFDEAVKAASEARKKIHKQFARNC